MLGLCFQLVGAGVALILLGVVVQEVFARLHASKMAKRMKGRHAVVTGGSTGLGLAIAQGLYRHGMNVTIIARDKVKLQKAADQIKAVHNGGKVLALSADVTDAAALSRALTQAEQESGAVFVLVTCAGMALTGRFLELPVETFQRAMQLNYFGTLHAVHNVAKKMAEQGEGHILLVSSALALVSYLGYSTYSPTKYAIRGLGDTLRNELKPHGISIYQAFPGQMDTDGYAQETVTKPAECKRIEKDDKLYKPEQLVDSILGALKRGEYMTACGDFNIGVVTRVCAGFSSHPYLLLNLLTLPILAIISRVVVYMWDSEAMAGKGKQTVSQEEKKSQ